SSIFAIRMINKIAPKLVADQRSSLIPRLEHSDPVVRAEAIATIREMRLDTPQVALAVARMLADPAPTVRLEAAETLAEFRHIPAEAAPALGDALSDEADEVQLFAI